MMLWIETIVGTAIFAMTVNGIIAFIAEITR